jgi:cell fate regulator YaaT (PSP1 superfamily)
MSSVTSYRPPSDSVNNPNLSTNSTNQDNKLQVVNIVDYQSAQKLSEKASQIFRSNLPSSNNTDSVIMTKLEKNMVDLSHLVENKAPAQELMMLVHGHIHPSLQLAYSLKLRQ